MASYCPPRAIAIPVDSCEHWPMIAQACWSTGAFRGSLLKGRTLFLENVGEAGVHCLTLLFAVKSQNETRMDAFTIHPNNFTASTVTDLKSPPWWPLLNCSLDSPFGCLDECSF